MFLKKKADKPLGVDIVPDKGFGLFVKKSSEDETRTVAPRGPLSQRKNQAQVQDVIDVTDVREVRSESESTPAKGILSGLKLKPSAQAAPGIDNATSAASSTVQPAPAPVEPPSPPDTPVSAPPKQEPRPKQGPASSSPLSLGLLSGFGNKKAGKPPRTADAGPLTQPTQKKQFKAPEASAAPAAAERVEATEVKASAYVAESPVHVESSPVPVEPHESVAVDVVSPAVEAHAVVPES